MVYSGAAVCCNELKNYGKAVKYLERAKVVAHKLYGDKHPISIVVYNELSTMKYQFSSISSKEAKGSSKPVSPDYDILFKLQAWYAFSVLFSFYSP